MSLMRAKIDDALSSFASIDSLLPKSSGTVVGRNLVNGGQLGRPSAAEEM